MKLWCLAVLCLMVSVLHAPLAQAHFSDGTKVRSIILTEAPSGDTAYVRMPLGLAFADVTPADVDEQTAVATPFLYVGKQFDGAYGLWLSLDAVAQNKQAFAARLGQAVLWARGAGATQGRLRAYRIVGRMPQDAFDTLERAQRSIARDNAQLDPAFGEAWVEMAISLPPDAGGALAVLAGYPEFPTDVDIDNHVIDLRGDKGVQFNMPGQLQSPLLLDRTTITLFVLYLEQGVRHIVEGIDHMALVVAMTLGTMTAGAIAWRRLAILVTAFTLGHSITLGTSVFGLQPTWPFFIPAVETAIALSMIYTAVSALRGKSGAAGVYFGIGIVHGLGFSLMLSRILGPDSPQLVWSLFSFNLGIELGQLMIVVTTGLVSFGVQTVLGPRIERGAHVAILVAISVLALFYVVTRVGLLA